MSSLRNAFKSQQTHRERHQPEARRKLGLLEKKKDYRQRAKDSGRKQQVLQRLRKKALTKNPDEFYFHMINSETKDGIHCEKVKESVLSPEQVKLMQTQDLRYVVHKRTIEKKKIEKIKANLHLIDAVGRPKNKHTFFVDSDAQKASFNVADQLDTHPALLHRTFNRPRKEDLDRVVAAAKELDPCAKDLQQRAIKQLNTRIQRETQLRLVQAKMEAKKNLQNAKDKPRTLQRPETQNSAPLIKWSAIRKR